MVGGYTGPSAIVDTAGVSGGEEAGYIRTGCEEHDTGDVPLLQEERMVGGCMVWVDVVSPMDFTPIWQHEVRLLIRGLPEDHLVVVD